MAKEFTVLAQDPDVEVADEDEDPTTLVRAPHPDVVESRAVAEGEC
jgi:hypothetical protein